MTAPTVVLPPSAGRDEWLAARRKGLGGSDAAAVAGLNPYAGPWSVWADKVGLDVPEREESEAMRWGTLLEPVISIEAAGRFGLDVRPSPGLVAHPDLGWQLATPDGLVGDDALLEIKNVGARQADAWESGPPDMYWTQGLHYVAVTGRDTVHFVALVGGQRLVHHPVTYTTADIDGLTKIEADFWAHVEAQSPPPAWPADIDALGRLDVDPADTAVDDHRRRAPVETGSLGRCPMGDPRDVRTVHAVVDALLAYGPTVTVRMVAGHLGILDRDGRIRGIDHKTIRDALDAHPGVHLRPDDERFIWEAE